MLKPAAVVDRVPCAVSPCLTSMPCNTVPCPQIPFSVCRSPSHPSHAEKSVSHMPYQPAASLKISMLQIPLRHEPVLERNRPHVLEQPVEIGLVKIVLALRSGDERLHSDRSQVVLLRQGERELGAQGRRIVPEERVELLACEM